MRKILFTAAVIIAVLYRMPFINAYAVKPELTVGFSAEENTVKLNWHTDEKNAIVQSAVYKYDASSKSYLMLARTDKTEYTDSNVCLTAGKAARYKIAVIFEHGGKTSKTVVCFSELDDIVQQYTRDSDGRICKAYVYGEQLSSGAYRIIYRNFFGDTVIGETDSYLYDFAASEDGKTVFYTTKNEAYIYRTDRGEAEPIFRHSLRESVFSSPNGKCCAFLPAYYEEKCELSVWYDGEVFFVSPEEDRIYHIEKVCDDGRVFFSAYHDDEDEDIYFYCLYEFNAKTGKYKCFARLEYDGSYIYDTAVFPDENIYTLYNEDFGLYCGTIGSAPKRLLTGEECYSGFFSANGKTALLNGDESIYSISLKSGKKTVITKVKPDGDFNNIKYSSDLSTVTFIDYENDLLVRLSEPDSESGAYAKRQEIPITAAENMSICQTSNNMNIVYLESDSGDLIAFFLTGKAEPAKKISVAADAYDRMYCYEKVDKIYDRYDRYKNLMMIGPDGSRTKVYGGYFFSPLGSDPEYGSTAMRIYLYNFLFDEKYKFYYKSSGDVYYINKDGKAVFGWSEEYEHVVTP